MQKNNHVLVKTWFARGNVLADWFRKLTTRGTIVIIEAEKQQDNNYDNNAAGTAKAITTASKTETHKYSSFWFTNPLYDS